MKVICRRCCSYIYRARKHKGTDLKEFEDIFVENGVITFDELKEMGLDDLKMIGFTSFGKRKKIINAVKSFESEKVHKMSTFEALEDILDRNKIVVLINGREEILIENVKSYEIKIPEFPEV